jgi:hypothetical protein
LKKQGVKMRRTKLFLIIVGIIALLGVASYLTDLMIADGGYSQAEFQITFKDSSGNAIEGIDLRVEDQAGNNYFYYPVTDYGPGQTPSSDASGVMVFHHVANGLEYSFRMWHCFWIFPVYEQRPPVFICRFLNRGQEVHRTTYSEVDWWRGTWDEVPKVKRMWKWTSWPPAELEQREGEDYEAWSAREFRFFDRNGNGKLEPEEAAAFNACLHFPTGEIALARLGIAPIVEEREFPIIQRTITVTLPPVKR